jgi:hypothetical protein
MASALGSSPLVERRTGERRHRAVSPASGARHASLEGMRVSWGGVWGGVLVMMASLILLGALGVAVGVTAVDPDTARPGQLAAVALAWGAVSLLLALFVGGMVATRIGMVYDRATGIFEGVLVWVVSVLLIVTFAGSGLTLLPEITVDLEDTRAAAWISLGAMVLSLLAAVLGALVGRKRAAARAGRD